MLKSVKKSILKISRFFGYDIVPLREMKDRDFALHLGAVLAQQDIDCILDVGANVGQYYDFLRDKVLYEGPIVSFEPVSRNIDRLRERARCDSAWHIEAYALGAVQGSLPINVMVSDQFSSFQLDTQGFDMEVLEGGRDSLATVQALQTEASVIGIYKGMPTYRETIRYLGERGFDLSGLYPVGRDSSLRLVEFDCVMIRGIDGRGGDPTADIA